MQSNLCFRKTAVKILETGGYNNSLNEKSSDS